MNIDLQRTMRWTYPLRGLFRGLTDGYNSKVQWALYDQDAEISKIRKGHPRKEQSRIGIK